jgi:hypothetical protein
MAAVAERGERQRTCIAWEEMKMLCERIAGDRRGRC